MNYVNILITILQTVGSMWSLLISSIMVIYGIVLYKKTASSYCDRSVQNDIDALITFEFIGIGFSLLRLAVLYFGKYNLCQS